MVASSAHIKWLGHTAEHSNESSAKVKNKCSYSLSHFQRLPVSTTVNGSSVSHFIGLFHATNTEEKADETGTLYLVDKDRHTHTHTPNTVTNYIGGLQPVGHRAIPRGLLGYSIGHKKSYNLSATVASFSH